MNKNWSSFRRTKTQKTRSQHHPPHIYLDDTWYIITASICRKQYLLRPQGYKDLVRD